MKIKMTLRIMAVVALTCAVQTMFAQTVKLTQIVLQATPHETLTITPTTTNAGDRVRFDVDVVGVPSALPTGSITFRMAPSETLSVASTIPLSSGSASWITDVPVGSYTISADYSGDTNYLATSASSTAMGSAPQADFDFSVSTITIKQGQSWTGNLQVIPLNGFAQTITFACAAPSGLDCSVPSRSYSAAQSSAANSTSGVPLTITSYAGQFTSAFLIIVPSLAGLGRRKRRPLIYFALAAVGVFAMVGCASSGHAGWQPITPKGKYQVTITGVSGGVQHTKQLTVIVD